MLYKLIWLTIDPLLDTTVHIITQPQRQPSIDTLNSNKADENCIDCCAICDYFCIIICTVSHSNSSLLWFTKFGQVTLFWVYNICEWNCWVLCCPCLLCYAWYDKMEKKQNPHKKRTNLWLTSWFHQINRIAIIFL